MMIAIIRSLWWKYFGKHLFIYNKKRQLALYVSTLSPPNQQWAKSLTDKLTDSPNNSLIILTNAVAELNQKYVKVVESLSEIRT